MDPAVTTVTHKIAEAEKLKQQGNTLFSQKEYRKAASKYRRVFLFVNGLNDQHDEFAKYQENVADQENKRNLLSNEESLHIMQVKVSTYSNLAMCCLKLERYEKAVDCCSKAEHVLASKATVFDLTSLREKFQPKLLYRKGLAYMSLNAFEESKTCLLAAVKLDSKNREMRKTLEEWKTKYLAWKAKYHAEQKQLFGNILSN